MGEGGQRAAKMLHSGQRIEEEVITLAAATDALSNEIIVKMERQGSHFMRACKESPLVSICSASKVLGITNSLGI